ncbi:MAG: nucleotidyltransferase domain-containing protein [Planctomycetes bacterium]|nr:nucleotidyltransferase domain-containing protein [Planctomycetota bacterium]
MSKNETVTCDQTVVDKILRLHEMIKEVYPVRRMILYGSHAKGHASKDSDIDVGVVIDLPDDTNTIKITSRLFHYASEIDTLIEPRCILWSEYQHCEKGSILSEIIRTGVVVA